MKGFIEDANYSIGLLDESATPRYVIDNYIYEHTQTGKNAFFVADLGKIVKKHIEWQNIMGHVRPFYTVRCNSSPAVLEILSALGTGFACASKNEMSLIYDLGISMDNVVYTNPCKQASQIKYAAKIGVSIMTCDNETELRKIARNHPNAKLLLHIATEGIGGDEEMNMTFGTTLKSCRHLLECAKELSVQVIGVKFHVSSSSNESQAYVHALSDARCVFDMAEELGFKMYMLDIGGGFSGSSIQLEELNHAVSPLLGAYFPEESGIRVIAEPGSYYVSSAFTLAVNIIAKKVVEHDQHLPSGGKHNSDTPAFIYCMNDGVYGSFGSKLSENLNTVPSVHKRYKEDEPLFACSLLGPSYDELDIIVDHCLLPELNVGDWIVFENMGSGSLNEQSAFSDFEKPSLYNFMSFSDWYEIQDAGMTSETLMKSLCVPCFQFCEDSFSTAA
ncbi:antizyme inhibitor 1 [Bombina bombina]|uniref:antizyme inhibitor 1 n=1 Tax=Bombina bombina TaxID=8345 RepID=UPI00235B2760|nr:antizyme inhibitor 1 [Bombina bombina]XP_053571237.1 antizyme inhibitor 1 [Bombina bombina]XP_053571238.1 antizyme inhibitor 1 [Bombina bombina]